MLVVVVTFISVGIWSGGEFAFETAYLMAQDFSVCLLIWRLALVWLLGR